MRGADVARGLAVAEEYAAEHLLAGGGGGQRVQRAGLQLLGAQQDGNAGRTGLGQQMAEP